MNRDFRFALGFASVFFLAALVFPGCSSLPKYDHKKILPKEVYIGDVVTL